MLFSYSVTGIPLALGKLSVMLTTSCLHSMLYYEPRWSSPPRSRYDSVAATVRLRMPILMCFQSNLSAESEFCWHRLSDRTIDSEILNDIAGRGAEMRNRSVYCNDSVPMAGTDAERFAMSNLPLSLRNGRRGHVEHLHSIEGSACVDLGAK